MVKTTIKKRSDAREKRRYNGETERRNEKMEKKQERRPQLAGRDPVRKKARSGRSGRRAAGWSKKLMGSTYRKIIT